MKYHWKRYWCPRDGKFILSSNGFLQEPGEDYLYNPDLVTFSDISEVPCLILLGEPGIGKSCTMKSEKDAIDIKINERGDKAIWVNLRSYGSEERLLKDLFDNEIFALWIKGDYKLYIFLDSLDECLLRISNLASLLADKIKTYPSERLFLRIASRTAEWPVFLEKEFYEVWGGADNVKIYELAPLTENNVIEAAKANNLDAKMFLEEINYKNVIPLAIKPLTLKFLLNQFKISNQLPYTQRDLYLRGCTLLCEESNENRIASRLVGDLTAEQRLIVAARIAAITLFANKYAIWTSPDYGNMPEEDVHIRAFIWGAESAKDSDFIVESFNIGRNAIDETLKTGLFSSRGPNRMGWVHKAYPEFLAAWYLVQHKVPLEKILNCITHPLDPNGKLVPQLHGVCIWLANMAPTLGQKIIEKDPILLLRCDLADVDNKLKENLVKTLFRLYNEKKLPYPSWQDQSLYGKVNYPRLGEQLSKYIFDVNYNNESKIFAIRIARACRLEMLQEGMAKIALDTSQDSRLRKEAAHNIVEFGTNELKQKLSPLATGNAGEDLDNDLRGLGLEALWPDLIGPNELFGIIIPPNEHYLGVYSVFLHQEIVPHIHLSDLPIALKWIESQQINDNLSSFSYLADQIMRKAWNHLSQPGIIDRLARAIVSRLKNEDGYLERFIGHTEVKEALIKDDTKRRLLISALVPLFDNISDVYTLIYDSPAVISNKDFEWILEQAITSKYIDYQKRWADIAICILDENKVDQIDSILSLYYNDPSIHAEFARYICPVPFNSPEYYKRRQRYLEIQQRHLKNQELQREKEEKKKALDTSRSTRIANSLSRFESGNFEAWCQLTLDLTLSLERKHNIVELEPDLTLSAGWNEANVFLRDRILKAALDYISSRDPETSQWLGTKKFYPPAIAGYKAFWLLFKERPNQIESISHDTWVKWAPAIIAYPSYLSSISAKDIRKNIISKAYQHASKSIIGTLLILIDKENAESGHIFIIRDLEDIWDEDLHKALLAKVRDGTLKFESTCDLLDILLEHNSFEARDYAESLFQSSYPGEATRQQAIIIGGLLLMYPSDSSWAILWPIIENNVEMGKEIIVYAAGKSHSLSDIFKKYNEEVYLTKLLLWLYHNFPSSKYSIELGGSFNTTRYEIAEIRDSLLHHLKERGTLPSLEALTQIVKEFPQEDWLNWTIPEAYQIYLYQNWIPYKPNYIQILIYEKNEITERISNNEIAKLKDIDPYLETQIYEIFSSKYQKERKEGDDESNSKTLSWLKSKLVDLSLLNSKIEWLDVGCGDGRCLEVLNAITRQENIYYHGIDSSNEHFEETREYISKFGVNSKIEELGIESARFNSKYDIISAILIIHEIDPLCLVYALRNMMCALKNDGTLVIADFQEPYELESRVVIWEFDDIKYILEKVCEQVKLNQELMPSSKYPKEFGFYQVIIKKSSINEVNLSDFMQRFDTFLEYKKKKLKQKRDNLRDQLKAKIQEILGRLDIDTKTLSGEDKNQIADRIEDIYSIKAYKIALLRYQIDFLDDKISEFRKGVRCSGAK